MVGLFWDLHQSYRISQLEASQGSGVQKADEAATAALLFQERLDKLTMISMALWELLKEHTDLTEQDLIKKVEEIDLSDGKLDGKVQHNVTQCPQCNRVLSRKHKRCLYCGFEAASDSAFSDVIT